MKKDNFLVKIGDWISGEIHSESGNHSIDSAINWLWACANQSVPEYAESNIGDYGTTITNRDMRGKDRPNDTAENLRKTLIANSIQVLVQEALNSVFDQLKLYGDNSEYIELITDAAHEWALECYQ